MAEAFESIPLGSEKQPLIPKESKAYDINRSFTESTIGRSEVDSL